MFIERQNVRKGFSDKMKYGFIFIDGIFPSFTIIAEKISTKIGYNPHSIPKNSKQ